MSKDIFRLPTMLSSVRAFPEAFYASVRAAALAAEHPIFSWRRYMRQLTEQLFKGINSANQRGNDIAKINLRIGHVASIMRWMPDLYRQKFSPWLDDSSTGRINV